MRHLILFDGDCPLCHKSVRFVLARDSKKQFYFAPLEGETAAHELAHIKLPANDTLVLIEDYGSAQEKILMEGRGALRICWHLGGSLALLGSLSFLPSFLFDLAYRMVAKRRYKLFSKTQPLRESDFRSRFLD